MGALQFAMTSGYRYELQLELSDVESEGHEILRIQSADPAVHTGHPPNTTNRYHTLTPKPETPEH